MVDVCVVGLIDKPFSGSVCERSGAHLRIKAAMASCSISPYEFVRRHLGWR